MGRVPEAFVATYVEETLEERACAPALPPAAGGCADTAALWRRVAGAEYPEFELVVEHRLAK
eukprot:gene6326-1710_t